MRLTNIIQETTLQRVYHHVENGVYTILTAYRAERTSRENAALQRQLEHDIRSADKGYFRLIGRWQECQDPNVEYTNCPPDQLREVREPSFFVPGLSHATATRLRDKYNQDAVLYAGPEYPTPVLLFPNGDILNLGKFRPNRIGQAYSSLKRGKNFVFECAPQSFIAALAETCGKDQDIG